MQDRIKYRGGALQKAVDDSSPPDGTVRFDLRPTLDEAPAREYKYRTRLIQTGMAVKDIQQRMENVFSELCPSGWRYHSLATINSSESVMVFEKCV